MTEPTKEQKCREIAEWLYGKSLDGFGIFNRYGSRIRERDFDSIEEAQRYIDGEDERLQEQHRSTANGINIQPCVKSHPDFYASEAASALALDRLLALGYCVVPQRQDDGSCDGVIGISQDPWAEKSQYPDWIFGPDRKTAIADAAYLCAVKGEGRQRLSSTLAIRRSM